MMKNVQVRKATEEDLPIYLMMLSDFHKASPMNGVAEFDDVGCYSFLHNALKNPDIALWVATLDNVIVGVTAALAYPLYFNPAHRVVQELWWWLTPEARGSGAGKLMLEAIENWSKEKNVQSLFMIALEDERAQKMEKVYNRSGFKAMERTFVKEVN